MLKKILFSLFLIILFLSNLKVIAIEDTITSEMEALNIKAFIQEGKEYTKNAFPNIDLQEVLTSSFAGNINNSGIYSGIVKIFSNEIIEVLKTMGTIIVVIIIHSILKAISENLSNKNVSQVAFYIQYILIVTIIMANFSTLVSSVKESISNLVGLINTLVPILLALLTATGSIASVTIIEPAIILVTIFIGNVVINVILPILLIATVIGILSNLNEKIQIGKLSKFLRSGIVWVLGAIISIFSFLISFEGNLTSNVDGLAAKGIKATVTNAVPVVGKALGSSVDTVLGCTSLLKNSIGIVGLIIIIGICITPIIKLIFLTATYKFTAAICEPIADKKIISLLEQIGDTFKVLLGIMFFVSAMFIIGVGITIKISNTGLMYR